MNDSGNFYDFPSWAGLLFFVSECIVVVRCERLSVGLEEGMERV